MVKLLKKGFYIVRIYDAKESITYDGKYLYDVCYFPRKKDKKFIKEDFNDIEVGDYFMKIIYQADLSKEKLLCQDGIDILYFDDYNSKFIVPEEKTNKKEKNDSEKKTYNDEKSYCVILEILDELDIIFCDEEYDQIVYEFNTKEELGNFINNKKTVSNKNLIKVKGKLELNKNIVLMKRDGDKLVEINPKSILKKKDSYEQIIIYPTKERYLIVTDGKNFVPEDVLRYAIEDIVCCDTTNVELEMFLNTLESRCEKVLKLSSLKEIKTDYFERDDFEVVCAYNGLWGFLDREDFEDFENLRTGKTYCDSLKEELKKRSKDALKEVKKLLVSLEVIDERGCILNPYNQILYADDNLANKSKNNIKN